MGSPTGETNTQPRRWPRWLVPTMEQRRRRLRQQVAIFISLAIPLVAYACFWPTDFESTAVWRIGADWLAFMLRTFALHAGIGLGLVAGLALLVRQRRWAIVAALLALLAVGPTARTLIPRPASPVDGPTIRLLSANLYAYCNDMAALTAEIAASEADVIALQEYTPEWQSHLQPRLAATYPVRVEAPQEDCFGSAIFSKLPLLAEPHSDLHLGGAGTPQLRMVIDLGGRPIALYNVHILPPASLVYVRINRAEFCDLRALLRKEELPVIVCGDFNFSPDTAQHAALRGQDLRDALDEVGWGPRWTWPVLGLRIDHIYLSEPLCATEVATGEGRGSDHRPVMATVGFRKVAP